MLHEKKSEDHLLFTARLNLPKVTYFTLTLSVSPHISLHRKQWEDPSTFNPERFLNADGTEVNRLEGEKIMIFGMGKRRCIGEVIARHEVFLFLAILIQKLHFVPVPGEPLDLTPEYGLTMKHKRCHVRATLRAHNEA